MLGTAETMPDSGESPLFEHRKNTDQNHDFLLNPFTGENLQSSCKLWFNPMETGSTTTAEEDTLPVVHRKGWVSITKAHPTTRELRLKWSQGLLLSAQMTGRYLSFHEEFAKTSVYSISISSFRCWTFEGQHMIEVLGEPDCSVVFIAKESPDALAESSLEEQIAWSKAFAMVLTAPNFQSSWVLSPKTLPEPWTKLDRGYFGDSNMFAANLNKVTPVVLRHISVASKEYPNEVDEVTHHKFLLETLLSFKIQGPQFLQFYGLFWTPSPKTSVVLDYYIVMELCEGGTLVDVLYERHSEGSELKPRDSLSHLITRQLLLELLSGILHLHRNQIVHRNLKPSTVALLRPINQMSQVSSGIVKILDLSHSACLSSGSQQIQPQPKEDGDGNIMYPTRDTQSSTDKASNVHAQLPIDGPETDTFAFGLILCEMMSCETPWPLLQHLPLYEIEIMVQYGSRPRIDDKGRLGMAGLVRMCLNPNKYERPTLEQVIQLVQHKEFFSTFECTTADDVLQALQAEFWTWSMTIFDKIYKSCTLLWELDFSSQKNRNEILLKLITIAQTFFGQFSQKAENGTQTSLFILPMEGVAALVLGAKNEARHRLVVDVLNAERRQFLLNSLNKLKDCKVPIATLRLLQVVSCILEDDLRESGDDVEGLTSNDKQSKSMKEWIPIIETASTIIHCAQVLKSEYCGKLADSGVHILNLMSSQKELAVHLAVSDEVIGRAITTPHASIEYQSNAIQMLRNLAPFPFVRVVLIKSMATLLNHLRNRDMKADTCLEFLQVMYSVTQNSLGAAELVELGGVKVLIMIAKRYGQSHPIFLECFRTLEQVALEPAHAISVANEQAASLAMTVLQKAAHNEQKLGDLEAVCFSLVSYIIEYPALQIELIDDVVPVLSKFTLSESLHDVKAMHGMVRCTRFLANSAEYRLQLARGSVHIGLMKLLNSSIVGDKALDIYIHAFYAINLFAGQPAVRNELIEHDAITVIINVMKQFNDKKDLQTAALQGLAHFVDEEDGRILCNQAGAVASVRLILTRSQEDVLLLMEALSFIHKLVNDPKTRPDAVANGIIRSLVRICKLESAHMDLVEESIAILSIIVQHENCAKECEELQVGFILQGLMDACPNNNHLQHHGAQIQQLLNLSGEGQPVSESAKMPFKVVVVGEMSVGKTCFVQRACQNTFSADVKSTIGVHIDFANIVFPQRQVVLQVYDTAGEERYRSHSRSFYRGAQTAILVYDASQNASYDKLKSFYDEVMSVVDDESIFFVVGTKIDLLKKSESANVIVEGKRFARSIHAEHFLVSSVKNIGVHSAFRLISEALDEKWPNGPPRSTDTIKVTEIETSNSCCT